MRSVYNCLPLPLKRSFQHSMHILGIEKNNNLDFERELKVFFHRRLTLLFWVGFVLFPLFFCLDYVVVKEHFKLFLFYRILVCISLLALLFVHSRLGSKNHLFVISVIGLVCCGAAISMMIVQTGGYDSFYYVGMICILVAFTSILPLNLYQSLVSSVLAYLIYVIPVLLFSQATSDNLLIFFNNNFFFLFFFIVGVVRSNEGYKSRKIEFKLRKDLEYYYGLLSMYVPPQVTETIYNGEIDSVTKHHRRKLTFFFSDIKDFTSMTDGMEPEDMAKLLNEYFSEMDEIINEYNGTLAQVTGDSLLVFFGAPEKTNDKDHALRCLYMAIDMQKKMKVIQKKWFAVGIDETFMIRCGINTGMATVGSFGSSMRKLYTAHGMQVNIAARLEQACEPGSILISHSTWALVNDEISSTEKSPINVKGYHKPVRIYKITLRR